MKLVKITKEYRQGTVEHFFVSYEPYDTNQIDWIVEDWCSRDSAGQTWGWESNWEFIEDNELIRTHVEKELARVESQIETLRVKMGEILNYLNN